MRSSDTLLQRIAHPGFLHGSTVVNDKRPLLFAHPDGKQILIPAACNHRFGGTQSIKRTVHERPLDSGHGQDEFFPCLQACFNTCSPLSET